MSYPPREPRGQASPRGLGETLPSCGPGQIGGAGDRPTARGSGSSHHGVVFNYSKQPTGSLGPGGWIPSK